jgi:rubrerythrin
MLTVNKFNLIMLKFTHGVEVGAHLAYVGHYKRTNDNKVRLIASQEAQHQEQIRGMLASYGEKNSPVFDVPFSVIGNTVRYLCSISPLFMLNSVAKLLEKFAVFSYNDLAERFPDYRDELLEMAETELEHEEYFKSLVP